MDGAAKRQRSGRILWRTDPAVVIYNMAPVSFHVQCQCAQCFCDMAKGTFLCTDID